jgi:hypothetical protein
MNITSTMMREISFQLTDGNPWFGMLLANEYLEHRDPLRAALVLRFKQRIGSAPADRLSLAHALIRGRCRKELSASQDALIGSRVMGSTRPLPQPDSFIARKVRTNLRASPAGSITRLALRQRNNRITPMGTTFSSAKSIRALGFSDSDILMERRRLRSV